MPDIVRKGCINTCILETKFLLYLHEISSSRFHAAKKQRLKVPRKYEHDEALVLKGTPENICNSKFI